MWQDFYPQIVVDVNGEIILLGELDRTIQTVKGQTALPWNKGQWVPHVGCKECNFVYVAYFALAMIRALTSVFLVRRSPRGELAIKHVLRIHCGVLAKDVGLYDFPQYLPRVYDFLPHHLSNPLPVLHLRPSSRCRSRSSRRRSLHHYLLHLHRLRRSRGRHLLRLERRAGALR